MATYGEVFTRKAFLPVIHVQEEYLARRSVNIARENGADGVFLINHSISSDKLHGIYGLVRRDHPDWWIGMNCLDMSAEVSLATAPEDLSAVWSDGITTPSWYRELRYAQKGWTGLYFGGVAFKYRPSVKEQCLALVALSATECTDVITTSGEETGLPPSVKKIRIMRDAIGDFPLAIASGISAENVGQFLPYVDTFLVASSIAESFYVPDAKKTRELADLIHAN